MKPKTSFIQQEIFYNSSEYVKSLGVVWMAISLMMIAVSVTAQPAHNGHVESQNGKHSAEYFNRNAMSGITADPDEPGSVVVTDRDEVQVTDRKSIRLNSSHVAISYDVFCLKKKIKLNNQRIFN